MLKRSGEQRSQILASVNLEEFRRDVKWLAKAARLSDSSIMSRDQKPWRRFMSNTRNVVSEAENKRFRVAARDFASRCPVDPKHITSARAASSRTCRPGSIKSHATCSRMLNVGLPRTSSATLTVPVGAQQQNQCETNTSMGYQRAVALP